MILLQVAKRHANRRFASNDAAAIQQWLISQSPAAPTALEPIMQPCQDLSHLSSCEETQPLHVKDISTEELRRTVSAMLRGTSVSELAELEQRLICQYEVKSMPHLKKCS